jgi:hypothetical protein
MDNMLSVGNGAGGGADGTTEADSGATCELETECVAPDDADFSTSDQPQESENVTHEGNASLKGSGTVVSQKWDMKGRKQSKPSAGIKAGVPSGVSPHGIRTIYEWDNWVWRGKVYMVASEPTGFVGFRCEATTCKIGGEATTFSVGVCAMACGEMLLVPGVDACTEICGSLAPGAELTVEIKDGRPKLNGAIGLGKLSTGLWFEY